MECLLPYLCMVTVPHIMVGLEIMLDYRGVRLARFHCSSLFQPGCEVIGYWMCIKIQSLACLVSCQICTFFLNFIKYKIL